MKFIKMNIKKPKRKDDSKYMWQQPKWGSLIHEMIKNFGIDTANNFVKYTKQDRVNSYEVSVAAAFSWDKTEEGFQFWSDIHNFLRGKY